MSKLFPYLLLGVDRVAGGGGGGMRTRLEGRGVRQPGGDGIAGSSGGGGGVPMEVCIF